MDGGLLVSLFFTPGFDTWKYSDRHCTNTIPISNPAEYLEERMTSGSCFVEYAASTSSGKLLAVKHLAPPVLLASTTCQLLKAIG